MGNTWHAPGEFHSILQVQGRQPIAGDSVDVYVSPSGNDGNPGDSSRVPFATLEKAYSVTAAHGRGLVVHMVSGAYTLTSKVFSTPLPVGASSVPVAHVSDLVSLFGTRTCTSASATGTVFTDSSLTGVRNGSAASTTTGAAAGMIRVTGLTGLVAGADEGKQFVFSGASSAGNNGTFQLFQVNSATSGDFINAQAVASDANNGAIAWLESFRGRYVECVASATSALVGQRRSIRSNTATSFTANAPFANAISIGDTFAVGRSGAILQFSNQLTFFGSALGFIGIKFKNTSPNTTTPSPLAFNGAQCMFEACEIDLAGADGTGRSYNVTAGGQVFAGNFGAPQLRNWQDDAAGLFTSLRTGSGMFVHNGNGTAAAGNGMEANQYGRFNGYFVLNHVALNINDQSSAAFQSLEAERVTALVAGSSVMTNAAKVATFPSVWNGQHTVTATLGALTYQANSTGVLSGIGISNSGGDGVLATTGASVTTDKLTGTANAGAGLHVDRSGYVQIDTGGASNTTITGTAGDTKYGHPTSANIQTYATVRTADGAGVKGYQDTYGNRIEP